jgi:hypothetical protein
VFAAAGGLFLLLQLARPLLLGQVSTYLDLGCLHLPIRDFYAHCLKSGESFDWLPGMHNGLFITGEGEHGPYHPLHLLLYRFMPLQVACAAEVFLSFPLMFLGTFVFLRRHAGRAGALLGALIYTFSANNVSHGHHVNYVAVAAHLPWLLWLLEFVFLETGRVRWRAAAGVGLLTGSQVLLGHPQVLSYSLLSEGLYALFLLPEATGRWHAGLALGAAKVLGLAVGGVQLLATLSFLANSNRGSFDPLFGGYQPSRLLQLLLPNLMCGHVRDWCQEPAYFGSVGVVLGLWWCIAYWHSDRRAWRLTRFALALGLLAAWLAMGEYGGLYLVQTRLPLVGQFRAPARYVNLVGFAAAVLAAVGYSRLSAWIRTGRVIAWLPLALPWLAAGVTIAAGIALQSAYPLPAGYRHDHRFVSGMVVMTLAAACLTLAARGRVLGLYGLLALAAYDLHHFCLENPLWGEAHWRQTTILAEWRAGTPLPPDSSGRVLCHDWRAAQLLLHDLRLVNGYRGGIEPRKLLDYTQVPALRLSSAAWYRQSTLGNPLTIAGLEPAGDGWFRVPQPLPRVRLVSDAMVSRDPAGDLATLDLTARALTTHEVHLDPGPAGTAALVEEHPGLLRIETEAEGRRLLVVSESHDPGWRVQIDGAPVEVERVNGDFLGCVVPAGRHRVEFTFRPASLVLGRAISGIGLVVCLFVVGATVRRQAGQP